MLRNSGSTLRAKGQKRVASAAAQNRDRVYTRVFELHAELRKLGVYLFGVDGVDEQIPLLASGRRNRRQTVDEGEKKEISGEQASSAPTLAPAPAPTATLATTGVASTLVLATRSERSTHPGECTDARIEDEARPPLSGKPLEAVVASSG